jgi:transposase
MEDSSKAKRLETFELDQEGLPRFCATLNPKTVVLIEASVNIFAFANLFQRLVKEVIVANTYQLKTISITDKNTDKIDAEKLVRMLKLQVLGGEQLITPVTIPPKEIQDLRALFATYRTHRKQVGQTKNRIHRTY